MGFIKETKKARGELASPLAMIQILLLGIGLLTEAFLKLGMEQVESLRTLGHRNYCSESIQLSASSLEWKIMIRRLS